MHTELTTLSVLSFSFLSFPEVYYLLSAPAPCPGILRFPPHHSATPQSTSALSTKIWITIQPTTLILFSGKTNIFNNKFAKQVHLHVASLDKQSFIISHNIGSLITINIKEKLKCFLCNLYTWFSFYTKKKVFKDCNLNTVIYYYLQITQEAHLSAFAQMSSHLNKFSNCATAEKLGLQLYMQQEVLVKKKNDSNSVVKCLLSIHGLRIDCSIKKLNVNVEPKKRCDIQTDKKKSTEKSETLYSGVNLKFSS